MYRSITIAVSLLLVALPVVVHAQQPDVLRQYTLEGATGDMWLVSPPGHNVAILAVDDITNDFQATYPVVIDGYSVQAEPGGFPYLITYMGHTIDGDIPVEIYIHGYAVISGGHIELIDVFVGDMFWLGSRPLSP